MPFPTTTDRPAYSESLNIAASFHFLSQKNDRFVPNILVVDDNPEIAYFLVKKLLPSFGCKTLHAQTGMEGLEMIRKTQPDIVLLDLQLPDMDGLDVLRRLATESRTVPSLLMTAHGSEQVAVDAFRLGVQDYLSKPVDHELLRQAITRILSQRNLQHEKAKLTSQLEEQVAWLTTLARVGQSLTSTLDLDEVLRRIVEAGVYLTKANEGFLALIDEASGQLYMRSSKNIEEYRSRTMQLLVTDTTIGQVVKTGKPLRLSAREDNTPLKVSTGFLVASLLHVPILSRGKTLGVLSVNHRQNPNHFVAKDEAMMISLADFAAIAIENANLYEQSRREVAERIKAEAALRESDERYSLAVKGTNDGIWDWNLTTQEVYYSPRWKAILGYADEELGNSPKEWLGRVHPEDRKYLETAISTYIQSNEPHFEHEHRILHKNGTYCWVLTQGFAVRDADGKRIRMAGSQSDITDRKLAEGRLIHNAFHDTLTSLPNRALLLDRLNRAILRRKRSDTKTFSILYLDLDHFKNINDSLGHATGDRLLVIVADILKASVRAMDTVARFGGDEFILLLEESGMEDAYDIAQRILKSLSTPKVIDGHEIYLTASIGIISSDMEYNDPEQLLRDADIAMYSAKSRGRARYELFHLEMRNSFLEQLSLEYDLRHAIRNNELCLLYQPIISLENNTLFGFEALVRWKHPINGFLSPKDFLSMAENTGLVLTIDHWALQTAASQFSEWLKMFPVNPQLSINVNLSAKYLRHRNLVEEVNQILKQTGLIGGRLKLEVTESAIMENNKHIMSTLESLHAMGVDIHIDDFGTGYSSLAYLHQFQVQALKIDRSFISNSQEGDHKPELIRTMLHLASDLGLKAIAEGIENKEQLQQLKKAGCKFGQGFLFSKPLDTRAVSSLFSRIMAGENPFAALEEVA
ncbi:MAG TPA: EAL domain-containing protein [Anaerolineales bacterium]|nr:EAL domain-containing protein [Anaerolineales bacterium]